MTSQDEIIRLNGISRSIVLSIQQRILPPKGRGRLFAPRCLDGHLVSSVSRLLNCESYGCEDDLEVSLKIGPKIDHLLHGNPMDLSEMPSSFSSTLLLMEDVNENSVRASSFDAYNSRLRRLLYRSSLWLVPGGVFIAVYKETWRFDIESLFREYFTESINYKVDQDHFLFIGRRNSEGNAESSILKTPVALIKADSAMPSFTFGSFSIEQAFVDSPKSVPSQTGNGFLQSLYGSCDHAGMTPLMPLKRAHLQMLISSGRLNNQVFEKGGSKFIIKAKIRKQIEVSPGEEAQKETQTESYHCDLTLLNITKRKFVQIETGLE